MLEFHCNYKSIFPACSAAASYCALALANSAILWLSSGADHARLPLQSVGAQASPDPVGSQSGPSQATRPSGAQVKQISGFPQTHFFFHTTRIASAFHCKALQILQTWNRERYRKLNCNAVLRHISYFMLMEARKTTSLRLLWSFKSTGLLADFYKAGL